MTNPFTLQVGVNPQIFLGRDLEEQAFLKALQDKPGNPYRFNRVTGERGMGKTTLLYQFITIAKGEKWETIYLSSKNNLINKLVESEIPHIESKINGKNILKQYKKTTKLDVKVLSLELEKKNKQIRENLKNGLRMLLNNKKVHGLYIAIDEININNIDDLVELITTLTELFGENHNIAASFAGVTSNVNELLNQKNTTFLMRTKEIVLEPISLTQIEIMYKNIFEENGFTFSEEHPRKLAVATKGYPYMVQLLGYYLWDLAENKKAITNELVEDAIKLAEEEYFNNVYNLFCAI